MILNTAPTKTRYITAIAVFVLLLAAAAVIGYLLIPGQHSLMLEQGYFPIDAVMKAAGYEESADSSYTYSRTISTVSARISFDFDAGLCYKNQYAFNIGGSLMHAGDDYYLDAESYRQIINSEVTQAQGSITAAPIEYSSESWPEQLPPLIAHAGGALREIAVNATYSNSLEALIQNYNLGHRVFEFDFSLTSDGELALVHDWSHHGGSAPTSSEWLAGRTPLYPQNGGGYTALLIDDLLNQMLLNRDIYLVTDTKSFELSDDETLQQFRLIYEKAMERDPELLNRIIPQIYNRDMYSLIAQIYEYSNVIYTLYADASTTTEVVAFASDPGNNVRAVTIPYADPRLDDGIVAQLAEAGIPVYLHTLNTYADITRYLSAGVYGLYTDLLTPADFDIYRRLTG